MGRRTRVRLVQRTLSRGWTEPDIGGIALGLRESCQREQRDNCEPVHPQIILGFADDEAYRPTEFIGCGSAAPECIGPTGDLLWLLESGTARVNSLRASLRFQ